MKNMPKDRHAAAEKIQMELRGQGVVPAGATPLVVVQPPRFGDYIAVTSPADADPEDWRKVLDKLPWSVRIEQAHAGSQGTTWRVHPADQ